MCRRPSRRRSPLLGRPPADTALPVLVNALVSSEQEHVLVLDDYHLISEPEIHEGMRFLLEHLPLDVAPRYRHAGRAAGRPIAAASSRRARRDPQRGSCASARRRLTALLNDTLEAPASAADDLHPSQRPDGGLGRRPVPRRALAARPGRGGLSTRDLGYDRHLVDYLGDEVLASQDPQARSFMVDTCMLDRFCAPLCDAVRGEDTSKRLLKEIAQANLFVVPLDGRRQWFRYHRVFRDVLRRELEDTKFPGAPAPACMPAPARGSPATTTSRPR